MHFYRIFGRSEGHGRTSQGLPFSVLRQSIKRAPNTFLPSLLYLTLCCPKWSSFCVRFWSIELIFVLNFRNVPQYSMYLLLETAFILIWFLFLSVLFYQCFNFSKFLKVILRERKIARYKDKYFNILWWFLHRYSAAQGYLVKKR